MSGYLLDTNVVSLLSPSQGEMPAGFPTWLDQVDATGELFLSVVTVHEIERGITLLEQKGATAKARDLRRWIGGLFATYADRVLPIDMTVSVASGQLEAVAMAAGHKPGMADALIAGTAKTHALTVVTLNLRHFAPFGVEHMAPPA